MSNLDGRVLEDFTQGINAPEGIEDAGKLVVVNAEGTNFEFVAVAEVVGAGGGPGPVGPGGAISRFDLTHAPVALYHFDGDLNDSSGNDFHLTGSGNPSYCEVWPRIKALVSGSGSRPVHDALLYIDGDITIEVLGCFLNDPLSGKIVGWSGSPVFELAINDPTAPSWFHDSAGSVRVEYKPFFGMPPSLRLPRAGVPWHLVARRASNVITFWLNGMPYGAASSVLAASTGSASLLEVRTGGGMSYLPDLFGLKIITSALTDQQIRDEYNRTLGGAFGVV